MGDHTFGKGIKNLLTKHYQGLLIALPPIVFLPIIGDGTDKATLFSYLLLIMIVYWITEFIPLAVTSILPVLAYPIMGIMDTDATCQLYFRDTLVMFVTSIMVACSIEYSNLHIRLALRVIKIIGCSPRRLHAGIILVSAFMSMWISNSAATAMMCPIIYAVIDQLAAQNLVKQFHDEDEHLPKTERRPSNISSCYFLSVAYASSVGGVGSLIGTPTNLTFKGIYERRFENHEDKLEFGTFMIYTFPFVVGGAIALYISMEFHYMGLFRPNSPEALEINAGPETERVGRQVIDERYEQLGPISTSEITIAILFCLLIVLYIFKSPGFVTGWADLFKGTIKNSVPTVFVLLLLFVLPSNYKFLKFWDRDAMTTTPPLVEWKFFTDRVPWGLIFLVGGGAAIAAGSSASGMAVRLGKALTVLNVLPVPIILLLLIAVAVGMTNFSANVAICNIILPVLIETAVQMEIHPLYFILPVGLACSYAFMLPVGTPPNALVQGYANMESKELMLGGWLPSVSIIFVTWIIAQTWPYVIYPNLDQFPDWAADKPNDTNLLSSNIF